MDQYKRISIYPNDLPTEKRARFMEALEKLGIHYTYEAY
jgi:hypothetical protein